MEYLHSSSISASKSELEVFSVPPTQVAIESSYEIDFRPSSSLESGLSHEIHVPANEDFTDLQKTMVYLVVKIVDKNGKTVASGKVKSAKNFGNFLFEQIGLFIGSTNTVQATNLYHYQSLLEDILFRYPTKSDVGKMDTTKDSLIGSQENLHLYFRLHLPLCSQDKLMLNRTPMTFRFTKSSETFPIYRSTAADTAEYKVKITSFALHIKRVQLFPEAQLSIIKELETGPAKYFITRNETKGFSVSQNTTSISIDNIFSGLFPRRIVIGFVTEHAFSRKVSSDHSKFQHFKLNHLLLNVDGVLVPSIPYQPNFYKGFGMREFVCLYRYLGQYEGIPQMGLFFEDYKDNTTLYAFDLSQMGRLEQKVELYPFFAEVT